MNYLEDFRPAITALLMGATGCAVAFWCNGYKLESLEIAFTTALLFVVYMYYSWLKPFWDQVKQEIDSQPKS